MRHNTIAGTMFGIRGRAWLTAGCLLVLVCSVAVAGGRGTRSRTTYSREFFDGRELFMKIWEPGKPSPTGGDGLGPLYNETSCVACHHLGGVGGAGGNDRNALMLTAVGNPTQAEKDGRVFAGDIKDLHVGFQGGSSVVIHRHATAKSLEVQLSGIQSYTAADSRGEIVGLRQSTRNTPSIFGAGLIDVIPDQVLLAAEKRQFPGFPEIKGRVSRLPDGRLGRFGWKGQTSALHDFVLAACSNELGLEVPGHHQASLAPAGGAGASRPELDLDEEQCRLLIQYVRELPPPVLLPAYDAAATLGYPVFASIGCATCHVTKLGDVDGLYSDMLLHDMGQSLGDAATYYGSPTPPGRQDNLAAAKDAAPPAGGAIRTEWRTPPLWGVADSAPYLHDGRARSLDEAILLHGGEAAATATRYVKLPRVERYDLLAFLQTLTAAPKPRKSAAIAARRASNRTKSRRRPVKTTRMVWKSRGRAERIVRGSGPGARRGGGVRTGAPGAPAGGRVIKALPSQRQGTRGLDDQE